MLALLRTIIALWSRQKVLKVKEDLPKVEKWIDVMKDKVILIRYTDKKGKKYNELAIASIQGNKPVIEFSLKHFFDKDKTLLKELSDISASNNLGEVYMAYINDYRVVINQYTGELILKEKLSIKERLKYKALWKKLKQEYNNSNK